LKLRQAAWYAVDLEQMAATMTMNRGKATYYNYWTPGILGYDESILKYKYDPAKAKQLMSEAGYPNGLDIEATTIAADPDRKILEMAKFMWDAVGLRTTIDASERAAALAKMRAGNAIISHYSVTLLPDPDLFAPKALICDSMNNWANWCNKKFDDCIAEGGQLSDPAKRHEVYKRCLTIFQEDAFIGSGYLDPYPIVSYKTVKGITTNWRDVDARGLWLDQ
jgi:peptide/nickel transport system substrate-binding protein